MRSCIHTAASSISSSYFLSSYTPFFFRSLPPNPRPTHTLFLFSFLYLRLPSLYPSFIQIEQKMLESAQNLLVVCQNETKIDKLREAVKTHQRKIETLRQEIQELKGQHTTHVFVYFSWTFSHSPPSSLSLAISSLLCSHSCTLYTIVAMLPGPGSAVYHLQYKKQIFI